VSESSSATVRADILQKYSDLFGTKTVNGRQVNAEDLIARLTRATRADVASLMQARHQLHNRVSHRQVQYEFLDPSTQVTDPDGNRATVADIRQGMIDGFFYDSGHLTGFVKARSPADGWTATSRSDRPSSTTSTATLTTSSSCRAKTSRRRKASTTTASSPSSATRGPLYCTRKSACPASPNATEVAGHRIQEKATRRILCRNDCLKETP